MNTSDFLDLVREAWPLPTREQHSLRTPRCPRLPKIVAAVKQGWTAQEREEHVNTCEYCQRVTAMVWEDHPPEWTDLIRYAVEPSSFPDSRAMQIYAERGGKRRSAIARRFVELSEAGSRMKEQLASLIEKAVFTSTLLPMPPAALAQAQTAHEAFEFRTHLPDTDVEIAVRKNAQDELEVIASSASAAMSGARVHVDVVGTSATFSCDVRLDDQDEGVAGSCKLGPFDSLIHQLGAECLVTAYLDETARGN